MLLTFTSWLAFTVLHLDPAAPAGTMVQFFLYDTIKISVLLAALIFVVAVLRTFIPAGRLRQWMNLPGGGGYVAAALFGAVTPFCSCSSIPIFFALLKAEAPLGVAFSFLITSPLVNEYVVVLMAAFFGWKIALLYTLSGIFLGIICGIIIGRVKLERFLVEDICAPSVCDAAGGGFPRFKDRLVFGYHEALTILRQIWLWVIAGVALGAAIHDLVPQTVIDAIMRTTGIWSVPLATLIGVPLYGSCSAIVPIAVALFQKGIPLGTALAFMMAISALSFPEAIMLRRAMKFELILIFFGVTAAGIMVTGYLFNAVGPFLIQ